MVVAVAGNVDHDEVVALVRNTSGRAGPRRRARRSRRARAPAGSPVRPALTLGNRDAEQTHVSLGVRTPGRHWKHRWALSVLNTALGRRPELPAVPSRFASRAGWPTRSTPPLDTFADTGALSVYAACLPERFAEVMQVTTDVLADGGARRHHRPTNAASPRVRCAGAGSGSGGLRVPDEPDRPQRAQLRRAPQYRAHAAEIDRSRSTRSTRWPADC